MTQNPTSWLSGRSEEIIRRIYPRLRRFAAVTGPSTSDPDDLVQEALLRTLRHSDLSEIGFPEAYLRRAILNLANNDRRRESRSRKRFVRLRGGLDVSRPDAYPSDLDELSGLAPQSRAVLYMLVVERSSHAEIAAALEITEAHSRMLATRAKRTLRLTSGSDEA